MIWHKHEWEEIARTYAEPCKGDEWLNFSADRAQALLQGETNIVYRCKICKNFRKIKMLGKEIR